MLLFSLIHPLIVGIIQSAKQSDQSIQQWLQSPEGQKEINAITSQYGPTVLNEILKKLGIK